MHRLLTRKPDADANTESHLLQLERIFASLHFLATQTGIKLGGIELDFSRMFPTQWPHMKWQFKQLNTTDLKKLLLGGIAAVLPHVANATSLSHNDTGTHICFTTHVNNSLGAVNLFAEHPPAIDSLLSLLQTEIPKLANFTLTPCVDAAVSNLVVQNTFMYHDWQDVNRCAEAHMDKVAHYANNQEFPFTLNSAINNLVGDIMMQLSHAQEKQVDNQIANENHSSVSPLLVILIIGILATASLYAFQWQKGHLPYTEKRLPTPFDCFRAATNAYARATGQAGYATLDDNPHAAAASSSATRSGPSMTGYEQL